jgi:perosamine synthetase
VTAGHSSASAPLPYGRQQIDDDDVAAVVDALRSDWLTTGPLVGRFEQEFAPLVGARHAVAVSSGTAALHAAMHALRVGPADDVLVPALTFVASANAAVYLGARPIFVDVEPDTLLVDAEQVEVRRTLATRALVAVDYAGQPCDYEALRAICAPHGVAIVGDACHALGGRYQGRPVGSLADLTAFSFHPVKHITTCEGGMVTCDDETLRDRMRAFRNHGIVSDHRERAARGTHRYEMVELGYNYRLNDVQCALGLSQLHKLAAWVERRRALAALYRERLAGSAIRPLAERSGRENAYHLFVVRVPGGARVRDAVFQRLRSENILANVHYGPVHLHPFYRQRFGLEPGLCPVAEAAAEEILSLPLFPAMHDSDVDRVVTALERALAAG